MTNGIGITGDIEVDKQLNFEDLKLLPGTKIDLRSEKNTLINGSSTYLGFKKNNTLIVSTPMHKGEPVPCRPDQEVDARFFVNHLNSACAFRSTINHVSVLPYPHIHLNIPEILQLGEIRKSARASVDLIATVNIKAISKRVSATISDISVDGAKIHSDDLLGNKQDEIGITTKIKVMDMENCVSLRGVIRTTPDSEGKGSYGIEFTDLTESTKIFVYAFVMSTLAATSL